MSQFYDQASLVMIPSGVKDGKVYSQKPLSTDGQLTFSRGSDIEATRINSQGLIEKAKVNLALHSEDATNAIYSKTNISVTANSTTAPDGTNTADTITATANGATLQGVVSVSAGGVYTVSVYLKRKTGTGQIGLRGISNVVTNVTITSEWQRYETYMTAADSNGRYGVYLATSGDEVYAWGFQINYGTIAQTYQKTTTAAVVSGITNDMPRLNYDPANPTCPSLLLEPSRTNAFADSEWFGGWLSARTSAIGSGSVVNATTSPEGVANATYMQQASGQTTSGGFYRVQAFTSGTTYTISIFAKNAEQGYFRLGAAIGTAGAAVYGYFDLINGTMGTPDTGVTSSIESYSNGWYRCTITATSQVSGNFNVFVYQTDGLNVSTATPLEGIYIYGAMLESSASYRTSYIPTYGTSATKLGDACSKTGITSLIGQSEGTVFVEYDQNLIGQSATRRIFALNDGTTNNRITAYIKSTNVIEFYVRNSGGDLFLGSAASPIGNTKGVHKIAAAYKNGDYAVYLDGSLIISGAGTAGTIPACSRFDLGNQIGANSLYEPMMQALLFKTRLSNADLATLTSL